MSIQLGNRKLGLAIWQWSVPVLRCCPGRSKLCERLCYGRRGHLNAGNVRLAHERNYKLSQSDDFVGWMNAEIRHNLVQYLRLAVVGDFYDEPYTEKWYIIMSDNPNTTFCFYTRSWRVKELFPILRAMSRLPNVRAWFSCDRETGAPPKVPGVRRAWMMCGDEDVAPFKVDLVFRTTHRTRMHFDQRGNFVCPYDHGDKKTTCSRCMLCYRDLEIPSKWAHARTRSSTTAPRLPQPSPSS